MSTSAKHMEVYDSKALRVPVISEFQELLHYRFLVWNLITRDLKVRYKRSVLGFVWVMLNPLLTMAVLTFVFSTFFGVTQNHYTAYVLSGLVLWSLYSQGSTAAMAAIQGSGPIIRKLYVPPSVFVASAVGSALVNFAFALVPFVLLTLFVERLTPDVNWLFILYPALLTTMFTMGVGLIVGAMIVFFNDTFEIYQVLLQAYYFLNPIFWPITTLDKLPKALAAVEQYNPMFLFLENFRAPMLHGTLTSDHLFRGTIMAIATLLIGWVIFTRVEGKFVYQF